MTKKKKKFDIKIKHPEFGHVEFRGLTERQKDVLKNYKILQDDIKKIKTFINKG